jgi:hypothetical protein
VAFAGFSLFLLAFVLWARRARTLFELKFRNGRVTSARGRMPQRLLDDFLVVLPRNHRGQLVVRCTFERDQPQVTLRGFDNAQTLQQLRNLIGMWPLARLRTAPRLSSAAHPLGRQRNPPF